MPSGWNPELIASQNPNHVPKNNVKYTTTSGGPYCSSRRSSHARLFFHQEGISWPPADG
jgi:hypothetical protein